MKHIWGDRDNCLRCGRLKSEQRRFRRVHKLTLLCISPSARCICSDCEGRGGWQVCSVECAVCATEENVRRHYRVDYTERFEDA